MKPAKKLLTLSRNNSSMLKISIFIFILSFYQSLFAQVIDRKPYIVYLRPGTVLKNLKDQSEVQLPKGIYAHVLDLDPKRRDFFHVYNKEGVALYETTATGIHEMTEDIRLLPNVDASISYPPPSEYKADNSSATYSTLFNAHYDNLQTTELNLIYSDQLESVLAPRYELRTLYRGAKIPVDFGLGVNYQFTSWSNDVNRVKLSILSFGPYFDHLFYANELLDLHAILGGEIAPIYRTSTGNESQNYKATLFDIGVEGSLKKFYGTWSLGAHYRRHNLTLDKVPSTANTELYPKEIVINSIGVMLGYKYDWDL